MCYLLQPSSVRSASGSVTPSTFSHAGARLSCPFPPSLWLIKAKPPLCHIQCHCNFLLLQGYTAGSSPGMITPQSVSSAVWWPLLLVVTVLVIGQFGELEHRTLQPTPRQGGFADLLPAIVVNVVANHVLCGDFP